MTKFWKKIMHLLGVDDSRFIERLLFRRTVRVFNIHLTGLFAAFVGNILLARWFGSTIYGTYALFTNWAFFLSVISLLGMDDTHLVWLPSLKLRRDKIRMNDHLKWSLKINGISLVVVGTAFFFLARLFKIPLLGSNVNYLFLVLMLVVVQTLLNNLIFFFRGIDNVITGEIADKLVRPVFFIFCLFLFFHSRFSNNLESPIWATILAISFAIIFLIIIALIRSRSVKGVISTADERPDITANLRYVLLNLMYFLATRIDVLLLGILSSTVSVAHYNVAVKVGDIISYPIAIINLSLPSVLSKLRHQQGNKDDHKILFYISRTGFLQCLALGLLFLPFGNLILSVYGRDFTAALPLIAILFASILLSASAGSIDVYFIMIGRERQVIMSRLIGLAVMVASGIFLIRAIGSIGAACSVVLGNIVYLSILEFYFYQQHGRFVHPFTPVGESKIS